jgi:hypothetical protein
VDELNGSRATAFGRLWEKALSSFRAHAKSLLARDRRAGVDRDDERRAMRYTGEADLPEVTDEELGRVRASLRPFSIVILKAGPRFEPPDPGFTTEVAKIIWAHGKRNASLRAAGLAPIVCPIMDRSDVAGIYVFDADADEVDAVMSQDPAVRANVFTYEIHPARGIPGSALR